MNLEEKLKELAQNKENLLMAIYEINGAIKILQEQILETKNIESIDKKKCNLK